MRQTLVFLVLGIITFIYAKFLNTQTGRAFARDRTAESVVIGTGITLAAVRFLIPAKYWHKVVVGFVVSGMPMIARSWLNRLDKA